MAKILKLFNGGGACCRKSGDQRWLVGQSNRYIHAYVAAYSQEDCRRVIAEYSGAAPSVGEIRDYWSKGTWGDSMKGVVPERGLWIRFGDHGLPVRVY